MHSNTAHSSEPERKREHNKGKQNVLQRQFQIMIYKKKNHNQHNTTRHARTWHSEAQVIHTLVFSAFLNQTFSLVTCQLTLWPSTEQYHYTTKTYTLPVASEGKETELSTLLGAEH